MLNQINAGIEACKTFWNGYHWMEDFGRRIADASNQEEMLAYRHKLLDMKQEMINLQQAFLQEQQSKHQLEELLRIKDAYYFNEDEGVYREICPKTGHSLAYCPKCMHQKEKAIPLRIPNAEEHERWICATCEWSGWSRAADNRIRNKTFEAMNRFGRT
jgi:hypothetical protein